MRWASEETDTHTNCNISHPNGGEVITAKDIGYADKIIVKIAIKVTSPTFNDPPLLMAKPVVLVSVLAKMLTRLCLGLQ